MSVQVGDHTAAPEWAQGSFTGIGSKIIKFYQAFPALVSERRALLMLGDAFWVVLAVFAAFRLWRSTQSVEPGVVTAIGPSWYWFVVLLGGWWVVAWLMDLYHVPSVFDRREIALRVTMVGAANLAIYLAIFFLIPGNLPRLFFLYLMLIVWPVVVLWRWVYAAVFGASSFQHRILIVGNGKRAQSIADLVEQSPRLNYRVIGYYGDGELTRSESGRDGPPIWSQTHSLFDLVQRLQVHGIVVAIDGPLGNDLFSQLTECQANGIRLSLMPDFIQQISRKVPIEYIDPNWALQVLQDRPVFNPLRLGMKRLLDLGLALVGLLVLLTCLPLVAIAIRLDSTGPIFFRQTRSGLVGKPFCIVKFRTMIQNAEKDGKPRWATTDDPRITRVGSFLRKTHLDELPQVLNVLRGEMSFVGPRPERPEFVQELQRNIPFYFTRLMVKPGVTGWAQTQYRYGNSADDALIKLQYDFYYLRNWSLWLDLYIIFQTFVAVLSRRGT